MSIEGTSSPWPYDPLGHCNLHHSSNAVLRSFNKEDPMKKALALAVATICRRSRRYAWGEGPQTDGGHYLQGRRDRQVNDGQERRWSVNHGVLERFDQGPGHAQRRQASAQ